MIFNPSYLILFYTIQLIVFLGFRDVYAMKWCDFSLEWFHASRQTFQYIACWFWLCMLADCNFGILGFELNVFLLSPVSVCRLISVCRISSLWMPLSPWSGRPNIFGLPFWHLGVAPESLVWSTEDFRSTEPTPGTGHRSLVRSTEHFQSTEPSPKSVPGLFSSGSS